MIFAEIQRWDNGPGYGYDLCFVVYNGDIVGTYRIGYRDDESLRSNASRDFHRLASQSDIERRRAFEADDDADYAMHVDNCMFHDDKPSVCDGSFLVEVTDDEQRAFEIAAMMAQVSRD
jgi:hypothetical protein